MPGWRIALWVVLVLTSLIFLYLVRGILLPFVVAGAICAIVDPVVQKLRRRGWPKWLAIWSLVILSVNVLVALAVWLTPVVTQQVSGFRDRIDDLTAQLTQQDETS